MSDECPMLPRIEALEMEQKRQAQVQEDHGSYLKDIASNVECMAESMKKLVEIIPLITMAQSVRSVALWILPICGAIAAIVSGAYWVLDKLHG